MVDTRRDAALARYRALRVLSMRHQNDALDVLSQKEVRQQGRRLGLISGKQLLTDNMDEASMIFDLLLYAAEPVQTRGIERYARKAVAAPGSDDELVIKSLRETRFSIWAAEKPHPDGGMILKDMLRDEPAWFMDEAFAQNRSEGMILAMRVSQPEEFVMHCGVMIPLDPVLTVEIFSEVLNQIDIPPAQFANGPTFAALIYQLAVEENLLEKVSFRSMPTS